MGLPKFTLATHHTMVTPEHTENAATLNDDSMASRVDSTDNSGLGQRLPPTFDGLPTELKKLIVHHADDSCLANLRLTNKELNAITTQPFGERLLSEHRFLLSEHSLQGLVDLTAHPDFGPCVRKMLLNTFCLTPEIEKWRKTSGRSMPKAKRDALWNQIQTIDRECSDFDKITKINCLVEQAMSNLKKLGNRVTLGVFDDVIWIAGHRLLRKGYGFDEYWGDISSLDHLALMGWVPAGGISFATLEAATSKIQFSNFSWELDLVSALSHSHSWLDKMLSDAVVMDDGALKRDVDVCVKANIDWTFRFSNTDPAHNRLIFDFMGTMTTTCNANDVESGFIPGIIGMQGSEPRYNYGSGTCSLYSPCVLGEFNNVINSSDVSEMRISSCATEADHLIFGICNTGHVNLQRLVLVNLHLFGHGCRHFMDEKNSAWPYLNGVRSMLSHHCPKLGSLVMERVYYYVDDTNIRVTLVDQRREWKGVNGVLSGLSSLVSEMTMLDEKQRERWLNGEIDADGNDRVEDSESAHAH